MATREEISIVQGDTKDINIECLNDSGSFDLTGATIYLTVKRDYSDTDEEALIQKEITNHVDPAAGLSKISFVPNDTKNITPGCYKYDLQVTTATSQVYTFLIGEFKILGEITKS